MYNVIYIRMCSRAPPRVRKLARALSLADECHAAYTKTNFPRVLHFSAMLHACFHSKALQLRGGFAL